MDERSNNMPLDFATPNPLFNLEGTELDFSVRYEPTRMDGKNMLSEILMTMFLVS